MTWVCLAFCTLIKGLLARDATVRSTYLTLRSRRSCKCAYRVFLYFCSRNWDKSAPCCPPIYFLRFNGTGRSSGLLFVVFLILGTCRRTTWLVYTTYGLTHLCSEMVISQV